MTTTTTRPEAYAAGRGATRTVVQAPMRITDAERSFLETHGAPRAIRQSHLAFEEMCSSGTDAQRQGADDPGQVAVRGTGVHLFFEFAAELLVHHGRSRLAPSEIDALLERVDADASIAGLGEEGRRDLHEVVRRHAPRHRLDLSTYAGSEVAICAEVRSTHHYAVTGTIDELYLSPDLRSCTIRDFKSGYQAPTAEELRHSFQFSCYSWLLTTVYPTLEEFRIEVVYPRLGVTRAFTLTRADIPAIERRLRRLADAVMEREATKTPGQATPHSRCWMCPLSGARACPVVGPDADLPEILAISSDDEARAVAASWMGAKARADRLGKLLRGWTKDQGPLVLEDQVIGYETSTPRSVADAIGFMKAVRRLDPTGQIVPDSLLVATDAATAAKVFAALGAAGDPDGVETALSFYLKDTASSRFDARRQSPGPKARKRPDADAAKLAA